MSIDLTKLNNLLAIQQPQFAEILAVYWSDSVTKYYAVSGFDKFLNVPLSPIEPKKVGGFSGFELNGDLSDENIPLEFSDLNQELLDLLLEHGEGAKAELFYYYPQVDLLVSVYWGQLLYPDNFDIEVYKANLSNGFKSRELLMPRRMRPRECTSIFGAHFQNLADFRHNGCKYNRHLGGSIGSLNGGVPFTNCGQLESDCTARGMTQYFMGFRTDVSAIISDQRNNFLAQTRGNVSTLKEPIRVIAGLVKLRKLPLLLWRREPNQNTPDKGWVSCLWEIGETVSNINNFKVNNTVIQAMHLNLRKGEIGQPPTSYAPDVPNYSGTAHAFTRYGWVNALTVSPSTLEAECDVAGYPYVRKYTDLETYTEEYLTNRAWWTLELYTNNRFGRGYNYSKFDIQSFIDTADLQENTVRFTDPFGVNHDHQRTQFNAVLEGKPTHEQIKNICRAGRMSVPFQHDGKYFVRQLKKENLENVRVFKDFGFQPNILRENNKAKKTTLKFSKQSNAVLTNHIVLSFLDAANEYVERPLVFSDPDQKALAGQAFGDTNFHENPKPYVATGVTTLAEAVKLGYSLLWFGEFDEGGIKNNLRASFTTTFEQVLGLKKYDVIKIESVLSEKFGFDYFRILKTRKNPDHTVNVIAQAYNETVYENFETIVTPGGGGGVVEPPTIYYPGAGFGEVVYKEKFVEIEITGLTA